MDSGWSEDTKQLILDALELYREKEGIEKLDIKENTWNYCYMDDCAICSVCGNEHYLGTYRQYATNFCPACGSKMKPV